MDRRVLEGLLTIPGYNQPVADISVLSCGCLISQSDFEAASKCRQGHEQPTMVGPIGPLRELWQLVESQIQRRRRSSSKMADSGEVTDLMQMFHKFAREEDLADSITEVDIQSTGSSIAAASIIAPPSETSQPSHITIDNLYEQNILNELTEEKEHNYSLCFPLHRKRSDFDVSKRAILNNMLKKSNRYISSDICCEQDHGMNVEVTTFVLLSDRKWELYEYVVPINVLNSSHARPQLICCGKSTGEFGENEKELQDSTYLKGEVIIDNDLSGKSSSKDNHIPKKLQQWQFVSCSLTTKHLVIRGTKGMVRVINIAKKSPYRMGQPIYTYSTNFPIKCIAAARNRPLVVTAVTGKERVSNKEQPFIILHRLVFDQGLRLKKVDPITITIPFHEPLRHITFNGSGTHIMCSTSWELRYLIIRLQSDSNDNYRKPRLIFTGRACPQRNSIESDLIKASEGITDIKFGVPYSNTVFISSCSLKSFPPTMIKLEGAPLDSMDTDSTQQSIGSIDDADYITEGNLVMKFPESGAMVHGSAVSPRGDGIVFLGKDGRLVLVNTTNFHLSSSITPKKKIAVFLGSVSGSEQQEEAASLSFSADGGKIFTVDRKGMFSVFDFTKGVPGKDHDVIKCKMANSSGAFVN